MLAQLYLAGLRLDRGHIPARTSRQYPPRPSISD